MGLFKGFSKIGGKIFAHFSGGSQQMTLDDGSWTPSVTATEDASSVVVNATKYIRVNDTVICFVQLSCTTAGTQRHQITIDDQPTPFPTASGFYLQGHGSIIDAGGSTETGPRAEPVRIAGSSTTNQAILTFWPTSNVVGASMTINVSYAYSLAQRRY